MFEAARDKDAAVDEFEEIFANGRAEWAKANRKELLKAFLRGMLQSYHWMESRVETVRRGGQRDLRAELLNVIQRDAGNIKREQATADQINLSFLIGQLLGSVTGYFRCIAPIPFADNEERTYHNTDRYFNIGNNVREALDEKNSGLKHEKLIRLMKNIARDTGNMPKENAERVIAFAKGLRG